MDNKTSKKKKDTSSKEIKIDEKEFANEKDEKLEKVVELYNNKTTENRKC